MNEWDKLALLLFPNKGKLSEIGDIHNLRMSKINKIIVPTDTDLALIVLVDFQHNVTTASTIVILAELMDDQNRSNY